MAPSNIWQPPANLDTNTLMIQNHQHVDAFNYRECFQSISSAASAQQYSVEELRLHDYSLNRGIITHSATTPFVAPPDGLVTAFVPQRQVLPPNGRACISFAPSFGAEIITFRVGKEESQQDFTIHKNIVALRSEFVRLALSRDWKEARERVIPLPEDEPEAFQLYQQWLYRGIVYSDPNHYGNRSKILKEYELLVDAYILGEKFMDSTFKDVIIDCIVGVLYATLTFHARLSYTIYENTPAVSPLRRLWQDIYVWAGNPSWLEEGNVGDSMHPEFCLDLSKYQMTLRMGGPVQHEPYMADPCGTYHEHGTNEECYLRQRIGWNYWIR